MHCADHFRQDDQATLLRHLAAHPLATVTTLVDGQLEANHLPLLWRDDGSPWGTLVGHLSRKDPLARTPPGSQVLVMFHGPQSYVSPNWYATKAEHGKVVPTWNHTAVHARGHWVLHDDPAWIRAQLAELTDRHEASQPRPWSVDDAPADFTDKLIGVLLGIEIPIASLQGKFKLSQNQPPANQVGVIQGLLNTPTGEAVARLMQAHAPATPVTPK
jgi:transcriptional regulator